MLTTSSKDIVLASQAESDKKYSGKKVKKKKNLWKDEDEPFKEKGCGQQNAARKQ